MKYYLDEDGIYRKIPTGKTPQDVGLNENRAKRLSRLPRAYEIWDGEKFIKDVAAEALEKDIPRSQVKTPVERQEQVMESPEVVMKRMHEAKEK